MLSLLTGLILITSINLVRCGSSQVLEQEILTNIFKNYDPAIRPPAKNGTGPVIVNVNTFVRTITDIDDVSMVYSVQLTFRQSWNDPRLRYNSSPGLHYVTLTNIDKLWRPDLFFSNEMNGHFHNLLTPNILIRIFPDGEVLYSTRISMKLFCSMDLRDYPMDNQVCSIRAASYGYTTEDLVFKWKEADPVQIGSSNVQIPKFSLKLYMVNYCTSKTNTGEYSCIKLDFHFSREFTFYLVQAYLPTVALVLLSWVTFWLRPLGLRLGVWIGLVIALILVTSHVGDLSPQVSYVKALDVWMGTCVCFLFFVLLQICVVNNALSREDHTEEAMAENSMGIDEKGARRDKDGRLPSYSSTPLRWLNRYSTKAQRIDAVSRVLFPASFAFFNFVYWITYAT